MYQEMMQSAKLHRLVEAREWIGTPYHHQAAIKGVGVDCIRFITTICNIELGRFKRYGRKPNPHFVIEGAKELFQPAYGKPGDIVLIQWRDNMPMHFGFLDHDNYIIHACGRVGRVVKQRLSKQFNVHSYWTV